MFGEHVGQRRLAATNISCYCYMHNITIFSCLFPLWVANALQRILSTHKGIFQN
jgi:hypothetical protein